jgi:hypothetical protein
MLTSIYGIVLKVINLWDYHAVRDVAGNVHASEERGDPHYSFLQGTQHAYLITYLSGEQVL